MGKSEIFADRQFESIWSAYMQSPINYQLTLVIRHTLEH